jgi:hypothetical protein
MTSKAARGQGRQEYRTKRAAFSSGFFDQQAVLIFNKTEEVKRFGSAVWN